MCLGGIWVLSPGSMEPKHHFVRTLKGIACFHLTTLRHQNTKTAAYQLSKNYCVRPFVGVFRFAREESFFTVAVDHPVLFQPLTLPGVRMNLNGKEEKNKSKEQFVVYTVGPKIGFRTKKATL